MLASGFSLINMNSVIFHDPHSLHIKSSTSVSVLGVLYFLLLNCLGCSGTLMIWGTSKTFCNYYSKDQIRQESLIETKSRG